VYQNLTTILNHSRDVIGAPQKIKWVTSPDHAVLRDGLLSFG